MAAYLKLFWSLCTFRRDPSEVPAGASLFVLLAVLYWISSATQSWVANGPEHVLAQASIDLALLLGFFRLVLGVAGRGRRFRQTVAALMGTSVVLTPLMLALFELRDVAREPYLLAYVIWAAMIATIVWYLFIVGNILRAALDTGLLTGMGISIAYFLAGARLVATLFPPAAS